MEISEKTMSVFKELQNKYTETKSEKATFLIYGPSGSGKSYSLRTAKKPLMVASFDPGGSYCLTDLVAEHKAIVLSDYEKEDTDNPFAFKQWDEDFDKMERAGIFNHVGTYVLDSATTMAKAALNLVLKEAKRTGGVPHQNDWFPQMILVEKAVRRILALPCDVILICHDDIMKDELRGNVFRTPMFTGKNKTSIPLLFDETYFSTTSRSSKGTQYVWQTRNDGQAIARSRYASLPGISISELEDQDFAQIMKKAGREYIDKPPFPGS